MTNGVSRKELEGLASFLLSLLSSGMGAQAAAGVATSLGWELVREGQGWRIHRGDRTFAVLVGEKASSTPALRAASLVSSYLEGASLDAEIRSVPAAERAAWEEIGADFNDDGVVDVVKAASDAAYEELLGRCLTGDQAVADRLTVDRSRVRQRVGDRSLYSFAGADGQRCFPLWQFVGQQTLPGLKTVLASLDHALHPLTVDRWFNHPDVDLVAGEVPVTPVEWLRSSGSPDVVADHARFL